MIQAFPPRTAQEPFADCVRSGCPIRLFQDLNPAAFRDPRISSAVVAIPIANQEPRGLSERVTSRSCCQTQASLGWCVTLKWTTRDKASSTTKNR